MRKFAYEFFHPALGWLRWEEGDRCWSTREEAEAAADLCPYKTRIVEV